MKAKLLALAASLTLFASVQAQATVVHVTYTGTVTGVDVAGNFGAAGADLTGKSYIAKYDFEVDGGPNTLKCVNCAFSGGSYNQVVGGTDLGFFNVTPNLSASIEIDGVTVSLVGAKWGNIYGSHSNNVNGISQQLHEAQYKSPSNITQTLSNQFVNTLGAASGIVASIDTVFDYAFVAGDNNKGIYCSATGQCINLFAQTLAVRLDTVETPLPGALPLFASGLGAFGLVIHRRRRKMRTA